MRQFRVMYVYVNINVIVSVRERTARHGVRDMFEKEVFSDRGPSSRYLAARYG